MRRWSLPFVAVLAALFVAAPVWADPLDAMEGYAERGAPPAIPGVGGVAVWVFDYALFAVLVVGLGWLLVRHAGRWARAEARVRASFAALRACCGRIAAWAAGAFAVAGWIFLCQWLDAHGLSALAMGGLALLALEVVRVFAGAWGHVERRA